MHTMMITPELLGLLPNSSSTEGTCKLVYFVDFNIYNCGASLQNVLLKIEFTS